MFWSLFVKSYLYIIDKYIVSVKKKEKKMGKLWILVLFGRFFYGFYESLGKR